MSAITLLQPFSFPSGAGMLDGLPSILIRYIHIAAGVVWIGMLYFFNLVNVNFQKEMTATLDPKSNHTQFTKLMPCALWWFRWGAMITWLSGVVYYLMFMSATGAVDESWSHPKVFAVWGITSVVTWGLCRTVIDKLADAKSSPEAKAADRGMIVAILESILVIAMIAVFGNTFANHVNGHVFFIAIGGGLGTIMFMNVWMIIWPKMRRVIAARELFLKDGTAIPPEIGKLARRAFLASRTNTWMSLLMLLFMILAGHGSSFWSMAN